MDKIGKLSFLPNVSVGTANEILTSPLGNEETHARFQLRVDFSTSEYPNRIAERDFFLTGPGEISGIDTRTILRSYPEQNATNVESNYFPYLEFDQYDYPWRYSPESRFIVNDAGEKVQNPRIRPWMSLILLMDAEIESIESDTSEGQLTKLRVSNRYLPDLNQSWAWAHSQIAALDQAEESFQEAIRNPNRSISRIFCPRYLPVNTGFTAFLVPTFERGRMAGLNLPFSSQNPIPALRDAWTFNNFSQENSVIVELPIYYQWRFHTGPQGDFENLVKKLIYPPPRPLPPTVGKLEMNINEAGIDLPKINDDFIYVEGALVSPASRNIQGNRWNPSPERPDHHNFKDELENIVNTQKHISINGERIRVVSPPLYGKWHSGDDELKDTATLWFQELNSSPEYRVIAGLGTQVIQKNQEQFMNSAWSQVEGIQKLNKFLIQAQTACLVNTHIYERDFLVLEEESLLKITQPILGQITNSPISVRRRIAESNIPLSLINLPITKLTRSLGPIGKTYKRASLSIPTDGVKRFNEGEFEKIPPGLIFSLPTWSKRIEQMTLPRRYKLRSFLFIILLISGIILRTSVPLALIPKLFLYLFLGIMLFFILRQINYLVQFIRYKKNLKKGVFNARNLENNLKIWNTRFDERKKYESSLITSKTVIQKAEGLWERLSNVFTQNNATKTSQLLFANTVSRFFKNGSLPLELVPSVESELVLLDDIIIDVKIDLPTLRENILNKINPETGLKDLITNRSLLLGHKWSFEDRFCDPVLIAPEFNQAMYSTLEEIPGQWLLPGITDIEENTVSLLTTNKRFVESFITGLNHEMSRELLWREFPTDQRGSYFRQFWDVKGTIIPDEKIPTEVEANNWLSQRGITPQEVPEPGLADLQSYAKDQIIKDRLRDVQKLTDWQMALGEHHREDYNPPSGIHCNDEENIVLLIRGELLRRYPNVDIYAQKAELINGSKKKMEGEEHKKYPIFKGSIEPDIFFLGFQLLPCQVGENIDQNDYGYFFIIEEEKTGPRFGLDLLQGGNKKEYIDADENPINWENLAWEEVLPNGIDLDSGPYLDFGPVNFPQAYSANSAKIAYVTFQPPFRALVHGSDMLPTGISLLDLIRFSKQHGKLNLILEKFENLLDLLHEEQGPFTIFAPTDSAFINLEDRIKRYLFHNNDAELYSLLEYHIVEDYLKITEFIDGQTITTRNGADLLVTIQDNQVFIDGNPIHDGYNYSDNGILYKVDQVLIP